MPASKRKAVMILVGGIAILATGGYMLFRAKDLTPGYVTLRTYLDDAGGLMDGTQVRLNGMAIGYLDSQRHIDSSDLKRKVEFVLKVRKRYLREIPVDSVAGLASDNLLGGEFVGIRRGHSGRYVEPGAELNAIQPQDMTVLMAQMNAQLNRLREAFTRADKLLSNVDKGKGAIGKIVQDPHLKSSASTNAEFNALMADIEHGHGTLTKLLYQDPLEAQLKSPLKRLEAIQAGLDGTTVRMNEIQVEMDSAAVDLRTLRAEVAAGRGSLGKSGQLRDRFDQLGARVDMLTRRIESGQGTIGQFMVNPRLGEALDATTLDLQALAKGLKTNPRKFVAIRLF